MNDLFNVMNKARYSGVNSGPKTVPTLFQRSAKVFVHELNRIGKPGVRIPELHSLPAIALSSIMGEMACYTSVRKTLHQELSDPVLFMRLFTNASADRYVLENCLRKASMVGKPVLPDVAKNWCKMMNEKILMDYSSPSINSIVEALNLGKYLHDAGWSYQSMQVLEIALHMTSFVENSQHRKILEFECLQKLLRAEGSALLKEKADETCARLLAMVSDNTDRKILLKVYLEVANHHFKIRQVVDSHRWTRKAMELMNDSTPVESVIEILQLEALNLFYTERYDEAYLVVSQAIHRARSTFGHLHRRYADTLYTYGVCLLQANVISDAIPIMLELLDVIIKLYGELTPHVAIIQSYLAYGFYRRSQTTGRFDMAYDHIQKAIVLTKQIMPERKQLIENFSEIQSIILTGRDESLAALGENRAARLSDFQIFTVAEIKQRCLQF
ncbi:amyloid protein-binding protein 2-like [Armigeres subalbatus]|uniref:amyloid protein-binding protein 2-like n=1 Tax=Armigeres subalbatus TaxID=124917 RepID=UPI002ED469A0